MKKMIYLFVVILTVITLSSCAKSKLKSAAIDNVDVAIQELNDTIDINFEITDAKFIAITWEFTSGSNLHYIVYLFEYKNIDDNSFGYVSIQIEGYDNDPMTAAYTRTYGSRQEFDDIYDQSIKSITTEMENINSGDKSYYSNMIINYGVLDTKYID